MVDSVQPQLLDIGFTVAKHATKLQHIFLEFQKEALRRVAGGSVMYFEYLVQQPPVPGEFFVQMRGLWE